MIHKAYAQPFFFQKSASINTTKTLPGFSNSTLLNLQQQYKSPPKLHLVKITSPNKGEQVPIGGNLVVSGTSVDNSSDCTVSVKVNGISPYHEASPTSKTGRVDYSIWTFTLTPNYTTIKQGQNKITAKFSCISDPSLVSHYSVNVTGIGQR